MLIFAERGGGTRVAEAAADDVYYLAAPCGSLAIREGLPVRPRESCWRAGGEMGGERGEEEREGMRRGEERRGERRREERGGEKEERLSLIHI